jgi:hypothetical protein
MMKTQEFKLNTIFTFQMLINMILSLWNIVFNCIGNIWRKKDIQLNGIGYGMTSAHPNLRATSHDIFFCVSKFD